MVSVYKQIETDVYIFNQVVFLASAAFVLFCFIFVTLIYSVIFVLFPLPIRIRLVLF